MRSAAQSGRDFTTFTTFRSRALSLAGSLQSPPVGSMLMRETAVTPEIVLLAAILSLFAESFAVPPTAEAPRAFEAPAASSPWNAADELPADDLEWLSVGVRYWQQT